MKYNKADMPSDADLQRTAALLLQMEKLRSADRNVPSTVRSHARGLNLVELAIFVISKLHFVLLGMLLGALFMGFYATNLRVPVYTATAKLYIMGQADAIVSLSDLQMGTALTMDYQEVFRTWEVHEMVNEALGTNFSYAELQQMLTVYNPDDTRILYIVVQDTDAQRAADIANAYVNAGKRFIMQTMNTDEPSAFSMALVPSIASSTSVTGYAIRGFLIGAMLSLGILVMIFLLDNRPKSPLDIMQYAGIPTLAVIPANASLSSKGSNSKKKRERKL